MELVIPRDLLCERAAAEILEHAEMADQIEKPARLEHAGEHHLQLGETRCGILAPADRAPRLQPFLADFTELLERSIRRYQNRAIETAQVIEELIALAEDMRAANARGEELGLTEDELAFIRCARNQRQRSPGAR